MASRKLIHITGEHPLVQEFAGISAAAGFAAVCRLNPADTAARKSPALPRNASLAAELTNTDPVLKKKNLQALDKATAASRLILSSSVTVSVAEQASWIRHPERLVGIAALPTLLSRALVELAPSIHTQPQAVALAQGFFNAAGKTVAVVQDRVGMVLPRIICMLVNEAAFAVMEGVASPADIDTAMKLGTNYPSGPLEWADAIGLRQVVSVLNALHADLGEERYRIAPLLKQLAIGDRWWNT